MEEKNNFEDELDFKGLIKSPSRLFGWIFPYYLVLFLIVGIYFVKNMNNASLNSVPANYTDSLTVDVDVAVKKGGIMPAVDLALISNPSSELIDQGKTLYTTNCSSCHGEDGKGDGVAAAALNPKPRNFHQVDGWTNGRTFTDIFNTLVKGVPGTGMIAYEFIPVADRIAIIQYLRTFADYPVVADEEIAQLDQTYELSKGEVSPNNITLEMATNKIAEENTLSDEMIDNIVGKINSADDQEAISLFNSLVKDKKKFISIFSSHYSSSELQSTFIDRVINSPVESGLKPSATYLSKDKLSELYSMMIKAIS